jgi:hypothetical protein
MRVSQWLILDLFKFIRQISSLIASWNARLFCRALLLYVASTGLGRAADA